MNFEERYFEPCHGHNIYKSTFLQYSKKGEDRLWLYADDTSIHYLSIDSSSDEITSNEIRVVDGSDSSSSRKIFGIFSHESFLYVTCKVVHERFAHIQSSAQVPTSTKHFGVGKLPLERKMHIYVYNATKNMSTGAPKLKLVQDMVLDYHPFDFQAFELSTETSMKPDIQCPEDKSSRIFAAVSSSGRTGFHIYEIEALTGRLFRTAARDLVKAHIDKSLQSGQQSSTAIRLKFDIFSNAVFLSAGFANGCYNWSYSIDGGDSTDYEESESLTNLHTIVESASLKPCSEENVKAFSVERSLVMDGAVNVIQIYGLLGDLSCSEKLLEYALLGLANGAAVLVSLDIRTEGEGPLPIVLPGAYSHGAVQAITSGDINRKGVNDIVSA